MPTGLQPRSDISGGHDVPASHDERDTVRVIFDVIPDCGMPRRTELVCQRERRIERKAVVERSAHVNLSLEQQMRGADVCLGLQDFSSGTKEAALIVKSVRVLVPGDDLVQDLVGVSETNARFGAGLVEIHRAWPINEAP